MREALHARTRCDYMPPFGRTKHWMDRAGQHEQVSLAVRSVVLNDLLGRNPGPLAVQPSIPDILRMSTAAIFDLELRFDNVGGAAAEQRFRIELSRRLQMVVGTLERFKPVLMRSIGPIAMCKGDVRTRDGDRERQYGCAHHARPPSACGGWVRNAKRHRTFLRLARRREMTTRSRHWTVSKSRSSMPTFGAENPWGSPEMF
jgi:hypothetical protein